jgi:hypothetical protein
MARVNDDFYKLVHTPVLFVEGGSGDVAYAGGQKGFENISKLNVPSCGSAKTSATVAISPRPTVATSPRSILRAQLVVEGRRIRCRQGIVDWCTLPYCMDSAWDVKSAHVK